MLVKAVKIESCNGFDCDECHEHVYDESYYVKKAIIGILGNKYKICLSCFRQIFNSFDYVNDELIRMMKEEAENDS